MTAGAALTRGLPQPSLHVAPGESRLRILHIAEAFGGGLMEVVAELAAGSSERGHDVLIGYGIRPETPTDVRERIDDDVDVRALPWIRRTPEQHVLAARAIRSLVDEWEPDVVHLHSSFGGAVGSLVIGDEIPTVYSPHAFASGLPGIGSLRRSAYRTAERMTCRRVTEVGAVSLSEAKLALKLGARRVTRVANGVRELNSDRVRTRTLHELTSLPPRVVALGRTVPQRQPVACARILTKLREVAEVEWLGGGGGSRGRDGYDALAAADIPPSGWLSRGELLDRVGTATAYLHWTAWDGLPLSVLEAMALDVVVVASDIPPNREILGPEGVCSTEAEAVARLRRLVTDPAYAERLRAQQRARRSRFSAENMVQGWHELYGRLLTREPELVAVAA